MPNWNDIMVDIQKEPNIYDHKRRGFISALSKKTGRNTITYYSAFLQKPNLAQHGVDFGINDADKNGFMSAIHKLDKTKGLDLILHTPGGSISATESIVHYLKSIFGNDIRAVIPQIAMSAGTMIACACKEIIMGKQSNLGPIDPQYQGLPAHGIIEEFETARGEILGNPGNVALWQFILSKYSPTIVGECQKAITWSESVVADWLKYNMFAGDPEKDKKVEKIINELGSHKATFSHSRHIHTDVLKGLGLKIINMEVDQELQDLILSVHHSTIISLTQTPCVKIIENQLGNSYIQIAGNQVLPAPPIK